MPRIFAIADIHGENAKLQAVIALITDKAGFSLKAGDELVQLGDKNDRGKGTYEVFEYFRLLKKEFPNQVHMLWGNHEDMMVEAAKACSVPEALGGRNGCGMYARPCYRYPDVWELFMSNGGAKTIKSYGTYSKFYGKFRFLQSLKSLGHWDFIQEHLLFLETENYFFCHAPIQKPTVGGYRGECPPTIDFRTQKDMLIWSQQCEGAVESQWIDPHLIPGKIAIYGHIHGMSYNRGKVAVPGIRRYGDAILLDTGSGCATEGYLSCLELPAMKVYDSRGEVFDLGK